MKNLFLKNGYFPYRNIHWIIQGFLHILDGLLIICSLGFYYSTFAISYIEWLTRFKFRMMKK